MNNPAFLSMISAEVANEELVLHPHKAIFIPKHSALIISDAHLGKADHFRKSGIAVPQKVNLSNLNRLEALMKYFDPKRIIFLGDLFHSELNQAWSEFEKLINRFPSKHFELVMGNHDILPNSIYEQSALKIYNDTLPIGSFILSHIPLDQPSDLYNLAGHIHPAVIMRGKARQHLRLPCFYFGKEQGIVPAFGAFTGTYKLKPSGQDQVFVISDQSVVRVR